METSLKDMQWVHTKINDFFFLFEKHRKKKIKTASTLETQYRIHILKVLHLSILDPLSSYKYLSKYLFHFFNSIFCSFTACNCNP